MRRGFVQGLAGQEQRSQAGEVVLGQVGRVLLFQHAHCRGGAEHHGHLVLLDQLPPDAGIGPCGQAFVHDGGHAGNERAVDDVTVAHHPANVAGGKIGFARVALEDVLHAGGQRHGVAPGIALNALGLAGGARGVEDVAGVCGLDPHTRHLCIHVLGAQGGIVVVSARDCLVRHQFAVHNEHAMRLVGGQRQCFVQQRLVGHALTRARTGLCRNHHRGLRVIDARGQGVRSKTTKHHRVNGANAHARQHGKAGLGDHRHVDQHAVALFHAQLQQDGRHALHFVAELAEGVHLLLVGFGGDEDQCRLIGAVLEMTVNRVVAQVGLPPHEPLGKGRPVVVADLLRLDVPVHQLGLFAPEAVTVVDRAAIKIGVGTHASLSSDSRGFRPEIMSSGLATS